MCHASYYPIDLARLVRLRLLVIALLLVVASLPLPLLLVGILASIISTTHTCSSSHDDLFCRCEHAVWRTYAMFSAASPTRTARLAFDDSLLFPSPFVLFCAELVERTRKAMSSVRFLCLGFGSVSARCPLHCLRRRPRLC
jgi:hypothetical protein